MGRMAEARKRAKKKAAAGAGPDEGPAAVVPPEPTSMPEVPAASESGPRELAPESDLQFPVDEEPAPTGKIVLPASGTAEEILARAGSSIDAGPRPDDGVAEAVASAVSLAEPQRAASISFFSSPAREERVVAEATEHLATFFLDREEYGVDVRLVQEIRRITEITQVPRAPDYIRGVINLRGRIIPVVDLKRKLSLGEVQTTKAGRIVVVKIQDRLIGMLVDGASQVLKVPVSSVEPPPNEVVERGGDYIRGVAKLEKRLLILVDLHKILVLEAREGGAATGAQ
jgi:purine-binding chemotaxis protein CheW